MEISASDLLKQVTASLEKASSDFSTKAEQAFKEAKAAGDMGKETKASIDKLATEFNTLTKASDALKAQLGEVEQAVAAGMGGAHERAAALSAGAQVIASEALKAFASKVSGNERTRVSVPVNAALLSSGVAGGVVEPQRLPGGATATPIDALRWAMLQTQLARVPASGHVLHFTDWAKIEMAKDTLGRYIIGNPQGTTAPTLWALPVVPTEAPAFLGKFLTGAFQNGAQLFDREDANVVISTENADDFERNMISVRCEERAALAVYRPEAFVFGSLPTPA